MTDIMICYNLYNNVVNQLIFWAIMRCNVLYSKEKAEFKPRNCLNITKMLNTEKLITLVRNIYTYFMKECPFKLKSNFTYRVPRAWSVRSQSSIKPNTDLSRILTVVCQHLHNSLNMKNSTPPAGFMQSKI